MTLWTSSCDPSATSSAVLLDPLGWCLRFSSSTEWMVYEMACFLCFPLLCTETGTQGAFLLAGFGVLQYVDKVVDVGDAVALWWLLKEFHIFSTCCSRSSPGIWTFFPRAPCSGSHLPLCVATVHGCSWANFVYFLREKWTRISLQFTLGNLELFLRAVSGSGRNLPYLRQSTLLLEEFHIFSSCWLSRLPCAVRT